MFVPCTLNLAHCVLVTWVKGKVFCVHAVDARSGCRDIAALILNLANRWR